MGHDFGVGLRHELVPLFHQAFLDMQVVFHDAVVHYHEIAVAVGVRMGVGVGRAAMSRPAGMANAQVSLRNHSFDFLFQAVQASHAFVNVNFRAIVHGNAGRIVPAVFQFPQAFQQEWRGLFRAHIAHNATHLCYSSKLRIRVLPQSFCPAGHPTVLWIACGCRQPEGIR